MLSSSDYHNLNGTSILKSCIKASKEKVLNIVFLGGSITYNPGWRNHIESYFRLRFPDTKLNFYMSGIPSLGSVPHAFRYQRDVLDHVIPDILFYESAVNDRGNGYTDSEQQKSIEGIFRNTLQKNPNADIIMMHFADPNKIEDYKSGVVPSEIKVHNEIAFHYGVPVIDISREIYDRICNGEFTWQDDIKDLHPSPLGQEYYSMSIKTILDSLISHTSTVFDISKKQKLPKPVYKNCYDKGCYISVKEASGSFIYEDKYTPLNGQPTREGFTGVPMLIGETPGDKLKLEFSGNSVGICVISGNDAGVIKYRIDNGKYKTVDLYTRWSASLHLPWYLVLEDNLKRGKHTLELEIMSDKNINSKGNACRIVHFLINK